MIQTRHLCNYVAGMCKLFMTMFIDLLCRALDSGGRGTHIPFRASKLTQVLKDSFVNAKARCALTAINDIN